MKAEVSSEDRKDFDAVTCQDRGRPFFCLVFVFFPYVIVVCVLPIVGTDASLEVHGILMDFD